MAVSLPQSLEGLQGEERWGWNENGAEAFVQVSSQDLDKVGGGGLADRVRVAAPAKALSSGCEGTASRRRGRRGGLASQGWEGGGSELGVSEK